MEIQEIGLNALMAVIQLYADITADLRRKGIKQWDRLYPNRFIVKADIKNGHLFGLSAENKIIGAVVVDTNESKKYRKLKWEDEGGKPLFIHRLAVHPDHQGKGHGKQLLQFAEEYTLRNGYSSIRLDVFSLNSGAVKMYQHAGYQERGMIRFPFRGAPYQCFEKIMTRSSKNEK